MYLFAKIHFFISYKCQLFVYLKLSVILQPKIYKYEKI